MYRIVQHRGKFSLAYTDERRGRIRIALGTNERGLAEARAGEIWHQLQRPAGETVADLWEPYAADRKANGVRADRLDSQWNALKPFFGHKLGRAITKADCQAFAAGRKREGRTPSTIRTDLEFLRACLRWHMGNGAPRIWTPAPSKPRERFLTKDQRDRLLDSMETPHVRLFTIIAFTTGARMGAILDLTWDRVDFDAGTIDFEPAGRDKTNKRRTVVPINERARGALLDARRASISDYVIEYGGKPVKSVRTAIAAASRSSGIPCSAHDFRRSAARWMAEANVSMDQIAQYLGHSTTRITYATYARFSPRFMADAAAALDW